MRRFRRSFDVLTIPSRVSPITNSGSSNTIAIATSTFVAKVMYGFAWICTL